MSMSLVSALIREIWGRPVSWAETGQRPRFKGIPVDSGMLFFVHELGECLDP